MKPVGEVIMMLLLLGGLVLSLQFLTPGVLPQAGAESETSVASAYPLPPYPLPSITPSLTDTPAEILPTLSPIDGATITPPPHTPFPTSTLDPEPTPTAIPLVVPAQNAEGKIFYFAYDDQGKKALHALEVDTKGKPKQEPVKIYEDALIDARVYPSPDGKRLAVVGPWGTGGILHIPNSKFEDFPHSWGSVSFFNWFPDNRQILYGDGGSLRLGNVITGKTTTIFGAMYGVVRGAAASPDGRKVIFSYEVGTDWQGIWMIDTNGQNAHKLFDGGGALFAWSPDGTQIAMDGKIMNADGTNLHSMATTWPQGFGQPLCYFFPQLWSPDSKYLAIILVPYSKSEIFCNAEDDPQLFQDAALVVVDVAGQESHFIPVNESFGNLDPAWSPDGKQITFVSGGNGNPEVWVANADGTNLQQLTNNRAKVRFLFWQRP